MAFGSAHTATSGTSPLISASSLFRSTRALSKRPAPASWSASELSRRPSPSSSPRRSAQTWLSATPSEAFTSGSSKGEGSAPPSTGGRPGVSPAADATAMDAWKSRLDAPSAAAIAACRAGAPSATEAVSAATASAGVVAAVGGGALGLGAGNAVGPPITGSSATTRETCALHCACSAVIQVACTSSAPHDAGLTARASTRFAYRSTHEAAASSCGLRVGFTGSGAEPGVPPTVGSGVQPATSPTTDRWRRLRRVARIGARLARCCPRPRSTGVQDGFVHWRLIHCSARRVRSTINREEEHDDG